MKLVRVPAAIVRLYNIASGSSEANFGGPIRPAMVSSIGDPIYSSCCQKNPNPKIKTLHPEALNSYITESEAKTSHTRSTSSPL